MWSACLPFWEGAPGSSRAGEEHMNEKAQQIFEDRGGLISEAQAERMAAQPPRIDKVVGDSARPEVVEADSDE